MMADFRVNRVSKIDQGRASWKHEDIALRGKDVDLVGEKIDLHAFKKLGRVLQVALKISKFLQPAKFSRVLRIYPSPTPLFVLPMGSHTLLGHSMHLVRADLHFDPLPPRTNQSRVEGLIHVGLGQRDIVLESTRHRRPTSMHRPETGVTVGLS